MFLQLYAGVCAIAPQSSVLWIQLDGFSVQVRGLVEVMTCNTECSQRSDMAACESTHVLKNALLASVLILAASFLASSETSCRLIAFNPGDEGGVVVGVESGGEESPD